MRDTSFFCVTIVLGELQLAKNITAISDWEFCHQHNGKHLIIPISEWHLIEMDMMDCCPFLEKR